MKLDSPNSQKIYDSYIRRVDRLSSPLPKPDKEEIRMEVDSHIYESMHQQTGKDEVTSLLDALTKLGEPEEYLKPLIAQKKLYQATSTFRLSHVLSALRYNIGSSFTNAIKFSVIGLLYLFLLIFPILIVAKLISPSNAGFFKHEHSGGWAFGYLNPTDNYTEQLGWWFIPLCIVATIVCYCLITLLLRLLRKKE
jgi:uncharacterized membrane protein